MAQDNRSDQMTYEAAMEELESIVTKMENGSLSLDESVTAYERGHWLLKFCRSKLKVAQARIQELDAQARSDEEAEKAADAC
ncbi:MAG: exodeoxyribonuclease VII small subunit [Duodenibacillus sp.]|nr:exodeoxyribonuclease VII small subunit [Duodenibacillus sp.]